MGKRKVQGRKGKWNVEKRKSRKRIFELPMGYSE
jgi:hypothetical protein